MDFNKNNLNLYLLKNLPSAFLCGVRVYSVNDNKCVVRVKHSWFNQNPFKSMYFAVQNMGAELTTGALVMKAIKDSGKKVSMLVLNQKSNFTKKATGVITFTCDEGTMIREQVAKAIELQEGISFWVTSVGFDEKGDQVGTYAFEWTIKSK